MWVWGDCWVNRSWTTRTNWANRYIQTNKQTIKRSQRRKISTQLNRAYRTNKEPKASRQWNKTDGWKTREEKREKMAGKLIVARSTEYHVLEYSLCCIIIHVRQLICCCFVATTVCFSSHINSLNGITWIQNRVNVISFGFNKLFIFFFIWNGLTAYEQLVCWLNSTTIHKLDFMVAKPNQADNFQRRHM